MRNRTSCLFVCLPLLLTLFACSPVPDHEALLQELRDLHAAGIEAHLSADVDFFTRDLAADYFSVGGGDIRRPTREEIAERFAGYLGGTTFSVYEDLQDPLVGISDDGSLGWALVQVQVMGERRGDDEQPRPVDFVCAWITLYRRDEGRWIRLGDVSSFR